MSCTIFTKYVIPSLDNDWDSFWDMIIYYDLFIPVHSLSGWIVILVIEEHAIKVYLNVMYYQTIIDNLFWLGLWYNYTQLLVTTSDNALD